jgi:starvation-inducible DNA-binding protein
MNTVSLLIAPRGPIFGQPLPAKQHCANAAIMTSDDAEAVSKMLARLIRDESALYAITRDWRYDAAGRKFVRLHLLLDEQFSEIGIRLTRLAARSRELGFWNSSGPGDRAAQPRGTVADGALQAYMTHQLLSRHEALLARLARVIAVIDRRFHDRETTELLADLIANHEKDAFMLRALLWEVQNTAA